MNYPLGFTKLSELDTKKKTKIKSLFKKNNNIPKQNKKKENIINNYNKYEDEDEDEDEDNLADFNENKIINEEKFFKNQEMEYENNLENTNERFSKKNIPVINRDLKKSPYSLMFSEKEYDENNYVVEQFSNQDIKNSSELMEKLNYMIKLLEEQKEEKTDYVTEEIVLYLFLGVFVIYVIDSFVKVGKYTR